MSSAVLEGDVSDMHRREMFETFQSWALQNYGDSGKTKTVTRKKYKRIVKILTGEEPSTADNSKFRFWVKAKGFQLGPTGRSNDENEKIVYVPTKQATDSNSNDMKKEYKRVAIVEDFFDIIYGVHVDIDGRGGKHAGQKRTYRAIAETYAFLPREAVTRFLMSCSDCQKRMHMLSESSTNSETGHNNGVSNDLDQNSADNPPVIDFSVPITQTYINHMRQKGFVPTYGCNEEVRIVIDYWSCRRPEY